MLQELNQPAGIFDIGLSARDILDVVHIDQQEFEMTFQQIVNGVSVGSGAFQGDMSDLSLLQPVAQGEDLGGEGGELAFFEERLAVGIRSKAAGLDAGLMHIECGAMSEQHFPLPAPFTKRTPGRRTHSAIRDCCTCFPEGSDN